MQAVVCCLYYHLMSLGMHVHAASAMNMSTNDVQDIAILLIFAPNNKAGKQFIFGVLVYYMGSQVIFQRHV